jgi:2,4-dienoyl-CoA reductase-like NADH-dependent reductase (Old Yellow Enzyme family)
MSLSYSPAKVGPLTLKNRLVMSPMTRSRALGNVPDALMVEYYKQRASSAGLIITEGTSLRGCVSGSNDRVTPRKASRGPTEVSAV